MFRRRRAGWRALAVALGLGLWSGSATAFVVMLDDGDFTALTPAFSDVRNFSFAIEIADKICDAPEYDPSFDQIDVPPEEHTEQARRRRPRIGRPSNALEDA